MNAIAIRALGEVVANDNLVGSLPALVQRAATQLANATTAAEVLDAKASAVLAYDAAKAAARFAKAKGAFDDVIGAVYRAQADALEIEAMAKRRFADEYDAAQDRGEVATSKTAYKRNEWASAMGLVRACDETPLSSSEIGVSRNDVYEARRLRDAEEIDPGFVRRELENAISQGREPTKSLVNNAIATRLNSFSGDNEWYTPAKYVEMAREVMGSIDVDPASNSHAQKTVQAGVHYTADTNGLDKEWRGTVWMNPPYSNPDIQNFVAKAISEVGAGRTTEAVILTNNSGDTGWHQDLQASCQAMCVTRGRIRFESTTRASNSPAMGQSFFYFGKDVERFQDVFSEIGKVWLN